MGIDVSIEDEQGDEEEVLPDPKNYLATALALPGLENTFCLRFIDPYGETLFNREQISLFIIELTTLCDRITYDALHSLAEHSLNAAKQAGWDPKIIKAYEEDVSSVAVEPVHEHVLSVLELAQKAKGEVHTYLRFSGD